MMKNGGVNEDQLAQCYIHLSTQTIYLHKQIPQNPAGKFVITPKALYLLLSTAKVSNVRSSRELRLLS